MTLGSQVIDHLSTAAIWTADWAVTAYDGWIGYAADLGDRYGHPTGVMLAVTIVAVIGAARICWPVLRPIVGELPRVLLALLGLIVVAASAVGVVTWWQVYESAWWFTPLFATVICGAGAGAVRAFIATDGGTDMDALDEEGPAVIGWAAALAVLGFGLALLHGVVAGPVFAGAFLFVFILVLAVAGADDLAVILDAEDWARYLLAFAAFAGLVGLVVAGLGFLARWSVAAAVWTVLGVVVLVAVGAIVGPLIFGEDYEDGRDGDMGPEEGQQDEGEPETVPAVSELRKIWDADGAPDGTPPTAS